MDWEKILKENSNDEMGYADTEYIVSEIKSECKRIIDNVSVDFNRQNLIKCLNKILEAYNTMANSD
jgi:hypothetical protein